MVITMKKYQKIILLSLVSLIGLYVAFMGVYTVTSTPRPYCASCHFIEPYVQSWEESPHQSVNCKHCHEFRGFMGKIDSAVRGINDVYITITNQYTVPGGAIVFEQNCIGCHLGDYRQFPEATRLSNETANHYAFIKEGRSCLECHMDVGHETNIFMTPEF